MHVTFGPEGIHITYTWAKKKFKKKKRLGSPSISKRDRKRVHRMTKAHYSNAVS